MNTTIVTLFITLVTKSHEPLSRPYTLNPIVPFKEPGTLVTKSHDPLSRVLGLRALCSGLGFRASGLGLRPWGLGFRVQGLLCENGLPCEN